MFNFKVTNKYVNEFDNKCAKVNAHGFLMFITSNRYDNASLLSVIAKVEDTIKLNPVKPEREINLNEEIVSNYINEFYSKYLPKKAEEVKQILNRTNPYFIDSLGVSHVNFINVERGDKRSSSVGHNGRNGNLDFNVYIHNSIDDLRVATHETAHAISSHHKHLIDLIRLNASKEQLDSYTRKNFERDCIGEIESHIVEKMFNRFMVSKGVYTLDDIKNYENVEQQSLLSEINLIREESDIIKQLPCPVNFDSLNNLTKNLQEHGQDRLVDRIEKMHTDDKNSPYMFRYVVGRVVSNVWVNNFDKANSLEEQTEMLNNLQNYLDKTHELTLDSACENLLGENFESVVDSYIDNKTNENVVDNPSGDEML